MATFKKVYKKVVEVCPDCGSVRASSLVHVAIACSCARRCVHAIAVMYRQWAKIWGLMLELHSLGRLSLIANGCSFDPVFTSVLMRRSCAVARHSPAHCVTEGMPEVRIVRNKGVLLLTPNCWGFHCPLYVPQFDLVEDHAAGDLICHSCGRVVGERMIDTVCCPPRVVCGRAACSVVVFLLRSRFHALALARMPNMRSFADLACQLRSRLVAASSPSRAHAPLLSISPEDDALLPDVAHSPDALRLLLLMLSWWCFNRLLPIVSLLVYSFSVCTPP